MTGCGGMSTAKSIFFIVNHPVMFRCFNREELCFHCSGITQPNIKLVPYIYYGLL